jgi:hypothetical protein
LVAIVFIIENVTDLKKFYVKLLYMLININICIDKLIPIRLYEVNHRQRNCDFVICDNAFFHK